MNGEPWIDVTWENLQDKTYVELHEIKQSLNEKIYDIRKEKDQLIRTILYLKSVIEGEKPE